MKIDIGVVLSVQPRGGCSATGLSVGAGVATTGVGARVAASGVGAGVASGVGADVGSREARVGAGVAAAGVGADADGLPLAPGTMNSFAQGTKGRPTAVPAFASAGSPRAVNFKHIPRSQTGTVRVARG